MPYIDHDTRPKVEPECPAALTPGDLNYQITRLVARYLKDQGLNYKRINDVIGVLECAKLELYRRIVVPYENTKLAANGDVYHAGPEQSDAGGPCPRGGRRAGKWN